MLYDCPCCFGDKPVFVRAYTRTRFGRKERVEHTVADYLNGKDSPL